MLVTFKQFICYPSHQWNRVGLNKILKFDLLLSEIKGRALFYQTFIYSIDFSFLSHPIRLYGFLSILLSFNFSFSVTF